MNNTRYMTVLASIKAAKASGIVDLDSDDMDFLSSDKLWVGAHASRARRCVETCVYGALDYLALPRFSLPAEYIAGCIFYYVHPCNWLTACQFMEGCRFSEDIINEVEKPITAARTFALLLEVSSGRDDRIEAAWEASVRTATVE